MNNRQLKFRVWHKDLQRYLPYEEYLLDFEGDIRWYDLSTETLVTLDKNLYIIEQFTGLYDKSGREIFEGDILLFEVDYEEMIEGYGNNIGLAVFTHGHYYFMDNKFDQPLHEFSEKQTEVLNLKIIGNINQNKELLN